MSTGLIVALDFDNRHDALKLIDQIDPNHCMLKVGSELFTLLGPTFIRELVQRSFKVFLDLKFHDIPNTVARACKVSADLGVWMLNVHALGGLDMMVAARQALEQDDNRPYLIAVTLLTSMNQSGVNELGFTTSVQTQALHLAKLAHQAGLDGVVCSAHEASIIKKNCGQSFVTVTPGIRFNNSVEDDQSRIMTPALALQSGSNYLVIGRPISRSKHPREVIESILTEIQANTSCH